MTKSPKRFIGTERRNGSWWAVVRFGKKGTGTYLREDNRGGRDAAELAASRWDTEFFLAENPTRSAGSSHREPGK